MTREEIVKVLVGNVENWELNQLLEYVEADMAEWAEGLNDENLIQAANDSMLFDEKVEKIDEVSNVPKGGESEQGLPVRASDN